MACDPLSTSCLGRCSKQRCACQAEGMGRMIHLQITGPDASPGSIAAADVARNVLAFEKALSRAAYLALRSPRRGPTGRHPGAVERASRTRWVEAQSGSFDNVLELADTSPTDEGLFELAPHNLSEEAFDEVVRFILDPQSNWDASLAAAIDEWSTELGIGERTTSIRLASADSASPLAVLDAGVRARVRVLLTTKLADRDGAVTGVLFKADFEKRIASVRLPDDAVVDVRFSRALEAEVKDAMREHAGLEGLLSYDVSTGQAVRLRLRSISRLAEGLLEPGDIPFAASLSIEDLAAHQGVTAAPGPDELVDTELTDDERSAFLAAMPRR